MLAALQGSDSDYSPPRRVRRKRRGKAIKSSKGSEGAPHAAWVSSSEGEVMDEEESGSKSALTDGPQRAFVAAESAIAPTIC